MSNYANLKSAIQSVIKTNGNNEITGQLLQTELLSMITTLGYGYQFMGVASPDTVPGTPDAKVFYIAYSPGTYTNFGGIVVTGLCVLKYVTGWSKDDIPVLANRRTGQQLGLIPNDRTAATSNGEKIAEAIASNVALEINDLYYISGSTLTISNIDIIGTGTLVLLDGFTASQASNFEYINLDGITIISEEALSGKNLDNTANSLGETTQHRFLNIQSLTGESLKFIRVVNCVFNNIFLFTSGNNSVEKIIVSNCRILNVVYRFITWSGVFHTAHIFSNHIERYNGIVFNINSDYSFVRDNFITNKEYVTKGYSGEIYLTPFVLTTKVTEATGNVWQDIVVDTTDYGPNFYTLYSKSQFFVFRDNVIKNYANINSEICYLVYSKTGVALRDVEIVGNSWENDDALATTYDLSASVCGITFFDTRIEHDTIRISGNTIKTPTLFTFGCATAYKVNSFQILNNTITAKDFASANPDIIAANSPNSQGLIQNNRITLTNMVGTDIGCVLNGIFGSVVIRDNDLQCPIIRNASGSGMTFNFSNLIVENSTICGSGTARSMFIAGKIRGCSFKYVGGGRNVTFYFQKITGLTDVRDSKILISTGNDTIIFRRILSSSYNSDYAFVAFSLVNRIVKICIDNVNSCIYIDGVKYTYTSTAQTAQVRDGNTTANISYGNDRISHVGAYDRDFEFKNVDQKDFNQLIMDSIPKVLPLTNIQSIDTSILTAGFSVYDSTNNRLLFWNGTTWADATGTPIS